MERGEEANSEHIAYSPYEEHRYRTAIRSIDTVRALHQTVVSLRSALDDSRQEIEKLKKQILVSNEIQDARQCHHPAQQHQIDYQTLDEKVSALERIYHKAHPHQVVDDKEVKRERLKRDDAKETKTISDGKTTISLVPDITISTQHPNDSSSVTGANNNQNNTQMASRIDVKIKVSSNINVSDANNETSTDYATSESSETPQPSNVAEDDDTKEEEKESKNQKRENPKVEVEMYEDSNTNTFNVDAKNLKIRVTSEENINVRRSVERISVQQSSTEYLNLDIDDLSEGDNSVFTEGATTPIEQRMQQVEDIDGEQALDNETGELPRDEREETDDIPEEVDDIELIFSSEDNKDMIQEDLVSISEYEPWQEPGGYGTPVLTKFNTLKSDDQDREAYYAKKKALKAARLRAKEGNVSKDKSLESTDSLSFDNNARSSLDWKSSLEKDSSIENTISRDNSFDAVTTRVGFNDKSRKWTNVNVLVETDISKVGIGDESILEMGRRNTCPNPPIYRPLGISANRSSFRTPLAPKYPRSNRCLVAPTKSVKVNEANKNDVRSNCAAAQTDITALPHQWRSETHLIGSDYGLGGYTLPSKYNGPQNNSRSGVKNPLRLSEKTQEARRVLLSDINFTSMVPELSRSADHLCQQKINEEADEEAVDYFKGNLLKTPDFRGKGLTPSTSTPGVSQWTVNESTTQTDGFWNQRGDSFESSKSYSLRSGTSTGLLNKHQRSRSVPSIRCAICNKNHATIKPSESMQYANTSKTVTFREPAQRSRGSLPDLRHDCHCFRRIGSGKSLLYRMHESSGSTESLLEEADEYLRHCVVADNEIFNESNNNKRCGANRRCSEADVHRDFYPSKQALPFLPKSPRCLKPNQLAKVIAKSGRIVVGKIRYVGPIASNADDETYIGLQLAHALGDCDGSFDGTQFFECELNYGLFVPYKKVVMAWN